MNITLVKHGGLLAGTLQLPIRVQASTLSEDERTELAQLLSAAKATPTNKEWKSASTPDAMSYTITVTEDDGSTTQLSVSDVTMSPSFAVLLQWLNRHGTRI